MLCIMKNYIIQGILLNVLLLATPVFLIVGHVVCSHSFTESPLKWSRGGVPMDPKISFRALARKRKVIGRSPSLTLSNFTLRFFWWQKKLHRPCASSAN